MCAHEKLAPAAQLLDLPHERALVGCVLDGARTCLCHHMSTQAYDARRYGRSGTHPELRRVGVVWHWYVYFDVVGRTSPLELGFDLHHVLYTGALVVLDLKNVVNTIVAPVGRTGTHGSLNPDQWFHGRTEPVAHQLKLTVWRDERYLHELPSAWSDPIHGARRATLTVRSFSNRDNRTHWWNLTSSISIAFPRAASKKSELIDPVLRHYAVHPNAETTRAR